MVVELGVAAAHARTAADGGWSDSSARSVLQLMVESVVEMVGFEVAVISVVLGDDLVTVAYAGPEEFREQVMTADPVAVLDPVMDQAESWGRCLFLANENTVGELPGTWIETSPPQGEGPDAWHPMDILLGVLTDDRGQLCGILSVDKPVTGRRPDAPQRRLLERYAHQAERVVITAFERERLVQQVAHAESARRMIRSASLPARASVEAVLSHTHRPLIDGFSATGTWIQALGAGAAGRGYARTRDGRLVPIPEPMVELAHQLAPALWVEQRVLVVSPHARTDETSSSAFQPLLDEARVRLADLGLGSMLAVPLGAGPECLGLLALSRRVQDPAWSTVESAAALEIGHDLGAALVAARALERERELVGELQQLDDYRTHLIQTLSHEMRTPLSVISGNLEMLCDVELDPDATRFRDAMARGTVRMQRVVEDLLLLATFSHPQQPLVLAPVDLNRVVHDVCSLMESSAGHQSINLDVGVGDDAVRVLADGPELDRLLSNLVSNALKYTAAGGSVWVCAEQRGSDAVLTVRDDGIGISEADQIGLFTSFYRTTNPEALREPGTGLGLSIAAHIAARHHGRIEIASRLGEGSIFTVTLPAAPAP